MDQVRESCGIYEAKTHLSELVERVAAGEEIVITRHGRPVALLVPPPPAGVQEDVRETLAELRRLGTRGRIRPELGGDPGAHRRRTPVVVPFVLDASAALNLILPEGSTRAGAAVTEAFTTGETAQVPALWLLEVTNALVIAERRGRIEEGSGEALLVKLLALPIRVVAEAAGAAARTLEIFALARAHRLTAYDGAYLWLAHARGLSLATADEALMRAARELSVATL